MRTETVDDPELLQLMRDSHCFNVYVGFESINPRTLKLFQKKQDLAKIERSIERFHAHDIKIHGMFVVGSDEDDVETVDATAEFALKHDIDSIQFMILTPIPGSPDWDTPTSTARSTSSAATGPSTTATTSSTSRARCRPTSCRWRPSRPWGSSTVEGHRQAVAPARHLLRHHPLLGQEDDPRVVEGRGEPRVRGLAARAALRGGLAAGPPGGEDGGASRHAASRYLRAAPPALPGGTGGDGHSLAEAVEEAAAAARHRLDCLITPIVKRAAEERGSLRAPHRGEQPPHEQWEKLPRVSFPLIDGQGPVFEPFAKIGLLATKNLDRIREAYRSAGAGAEGLWEAA